jgi:peptide deformylase
MAILPLVIAPDPILKTPSKAVDRVDDAVRALLEDMLDTMYDSRGIGLAAVQVGVHRKLIVVDVDWREEESDSRNALKMVNAEILSFSPETKPYQEGCLSFPEQYSEVIRPAQIEVKYLDENGNPQQLKAEGLLATCIQHEIDHTNGITFVDHISKLKRDMIHKKLTKMKKQGRFDHEHGCGDPHCHEEH